MPAPVLDAIGAGGTGSAASPSSVTESHTTSGSSPGLVAWAWVVTSAGSTAGLTCAATHNGIAMTASGSVFVGASWALFQFTTTGQATGAHNVVATATQAGATLTVTVNSLSFNNVASIGTNNSGSSTASATWALSSIVSDVTEMMAYGIGGWFASATTSNRTIDATQSPGSGAFLTVGHGLGANPIVLTGNMSASATYGALGVRILGTSSTNWTGDTAPAATGAVASTGKLNALANTTVPAVGAVASTGKLNELGAVAVSGVGAVAATGVVAVKGNTSLAGTGAVASAATKAAQGNSSLTGVGVIADTGIETDLANTSIVGTGNVSSTGKLNQVSNASLLVTAAQVLTALLRALGVTNVPGIGAISSTGSKSTPGNTALSGVGTITVDGGRRAVGNVAIAGIGAIGVAAQDVELGNVTVHAVGVVSSNGVVAPAGNTLINGVGAVTCDGTLKLRRPQTGWFHKGE